MNFFFSLIAGMTNAEVLSQVEHGYRMPMPPNCTPALYEIMLECWHKVILFRLI
jgi:Protein tyrosine and serine/threonine kinase